MMRTSYLPADNDIDSKTGQIQFASIVQQSRPAITVLTAGQLV